MDGKLRRDVDVRIAAFSRSVLCKDYAHAFAVDQDTYNSLLKAHEDSSAYDYWFDETSAARESLVLEFSSTTGKLNHHPPIAQLLAEDGGNQKSLLFLLSNFSGLAHEVALRMVLNSISRVHRNYARYGLAYVVDNNDGWRDFYKEIFDFKISHNNTEFSYRAIVGLGQFLRRAQISHCVVVANFSLAFWLSLQLKPNSVSFWATKTYPRHVKSISKYFCAGKNGSIVNIRGEYWCGVDIPAPIIRSQSRCTDTNVPQRVSSISRIEKNRQDEYLRAIRGILSRCPSAEFCYTGRGEDTLDIKGYEPRVKPVGWVNPNEYFDTIDLYAEPFPFGGGIMLYEAVSRGIPWVMMRSKASTSQLRHAEDFLMRSLPEDILEFAEKYMFATTPTDYIEKCVLLLTDQSIKMRYDYIFKAHESSGSKTELNVKNPFDCLFQGDALC